MKTMRVTNNFDVKRVTLSTLVRKLRRWLSHTAIFSAVSCFPSAWYWMMFIMSAFIDTANVTQ